ncbi:MAG: HyaD/HybD family hydrogenase maturation endopeptidase [Anaerolineae bacterium]|nr:HyaD/HybD family hydrogenase maturation endopeptidase [Anaerolineae bacterium]
MPAEPPVLVLGLGNILFGDEGLGVHAVQQLSRVCTLPDGVRCLDGGTLGLDLLCYFTADVRILILDAVRTGGAPGSLIRLEGSQIPAALSQKMSMHQLGLQDLMAASALRGMLPERVVLWGMQPALMDWSTDLSAEVERAMPELVEAAIQELADWGVAVSRRFADLPLPVD